MNEIIISIKHEYAQAIYEGRKTVEFRRRLPRFLLNTKCWIYEPKPIGLITGYFIYGGVFYGSLGRVWSWCADGAGISYSVYHEYFHGVSSAYALIIKQPHRFGPVPLAYFGVAHAPQSYLKLK